MSPTFTRFTHLAPMTANKVPASTFPHTEEKDQESFL